MPDRVRLGVKWSPIAADALQLVDLIEIAGWQLAEPRPDLPCLLHNLDLDFSLAAPDVIDDAWAERCAVAITQSGTPWFSLHLGFSAEEVRFDDHMHPASPVLEHRVCLDRMTQTLSFARERLPVPLLIENLDYCPEGAYEHVCDPAFINEVLDATGCDLLLDLAHAQVSADWLGWEIHDYLGRLPLDRIVELHLSSPRRSGPRLDDGHHELLEQDYILLDWVLARCQPRAVVLEYTRDAAKLQEQLTELRRHIDR